MPGQTDGDVMLASYGDLGDTSEFMSILDGMLPWPSITSVCGLCSSPGTGSE